jgi:hypothetical protein
VCVFVCVCVRARLFVCLCLCARVCMFVLYGWCATHAVCFDVFDSNRDGGVSREEFARVLRVVAAGRDAPPPDAVAAAAACDGGAADALEGADQAGMGVNAPRGTPTAVPPPPPPHTHTHTHTHTNMLAHARAHTNAQSPRSRTRHVPLARSRVGGGLRSRGQGRRWDAVV